MTMSSKETSEKENKGKNWKTSRDPQYTQLIESIEAKNFAQTKELLSTFVGHTQSKVFVNTLSNFRLVCFATIEEFSSEISVKF